MGMSLAAEMQAVIANLESREWIQRTEVDGDAVCAHGAVKTCKALRPGDEQIIKAVMRTKGVTEKWNDEDGRTKSQVLARMRQIEVSDDDLADTFGPNWRLVIAVVRRAAILTTGEVRQLSITRRGMRYSAWSSAWSSARDAASDAERNAEWYAAWNAARCSTLHRSAVGAFVGATCVVADLVGQHGFTQKHIDTLMKPWTDVLSENWAEGMLP